MLLRHNSCRIARRLPCVRTTPYRASDGLCSRRGALLVCQRAHASAPPSLESSVKEPNAGLVEGTLLQEELRYLEEADLRRRHRELPDAPRWDAFKEQVDRAAVPVDVRVRPIYATLTLSFVAQGIQFPVLPQLTRALELSTSDLGLVTATTALARLCANAPAAAAAERVGRRPLLMAGPAAASVGMGLLAASSCFGHLVVANCCLGVGLATTMAGAQLYLADISTPKNRAQTTAPILQSALIGFAVGPAVGGLLAQSSLTLPFVVCAGGLAASAGASALLLPETLHEATQRTERLRQWRQPAASPQTPASSSASPSPSSAASSSSSSASSARDAASDASSSGMTQQLLRRPALQGIGGLAFMNGFSQGAFPVTMGARESGDRARAARIALERETAHERHRT